MLLVLLQWNISAGYFGPAFLILIPQDAKRAEGTMHAGVGGMSLVGHGASMCRRLGKYMYVLGLSVFHSF